MSKRCVGCMKIKTQSPVCEHCGYNENIPNYAHQLPIGTVLHGQYTVGKVLGQGGFGITYIGWDNSLDAPVGIKEFYPNSIVTRECVLSLDVHCAGKEAEGLFYHNRERFLREAKILAKLQNVPGIVRVQNLFAENNTAYIVMEYVEGIDLKHYIRMRNRVLSPEEAFAVFRPMMYALSKVHEAELVHRDISPDNIMIQTDGTAKLLDFGAAREVENAEVDKELPRSTEAILKHGFAPMEQYQRRGTLGPWTDVYALCATMYYCLTGKVPADAPERIMGSDNVNWRQIPGLTEQQIQTLEKGLALLPENRIRTMKELHNGLFGQTVTSFTQVQKEEPKKEPEKKPEPKKKPEKKAEKKPDYPTHTVSLEEPAKPKKRKKPFGLIAAALAIVAAVGAFALKPREEVGTTAAPEEKPSVSATEPAVTLPPSEEEKQYLAAEELEKAGEYGKAAIAFGKLGDFEDARERSFGLWDAVASRKTLAADMIYTAAITEEGTVLADGCSEEVQKEVARWKDIVAVTIGCNHIVGLKADGTVVAAGSNEFGQCDVADWTDIVAISADEAHTVGLKSDGTVVAAGSNEDYGRNTHRCDVSRWTDIIAISTGQWNTVGLRTDGTVVVAGYGEWDQKDVADWTDIVSVSAASLHVVGLKSDGTVVAAGYNTFMQCHVSNWTDIVAVSAGERHTLGLKSDGTVVAAGSNKDNIGNHAGQCDVSSWRDIVAIDAGSVHSVALKSDGTVEGKGPWHISLDQARSWTDIRLPAPRVQTKSAAQPEPVVSPDVPSGNVLSKEWFKRFPDSVAQNQISSITFLNTLKEAPTDAWDVSEEKNGRVLAWVAENGDTKDVFIGAEAGIYAPTDCSYLFYGFAKVKEIQFNGYFHTDYVKDMSSMFYGCTRLSSLDVSDFNTSHVTKMSGMFNGCSSLEELDVSGFDTSWVVTMDYMFHQCSRLRNLDVSNFDTRLVIDMARMFHSCRGLTSLDLSNFTTSSVTDMSWMFYYCSGLETLDITGFDTKHVTNMNGMFYDCSRLKNLDVSHFDTSKVTDMERMFRGCTELGDLDLRNWNVAKVTSHGYFMDGDKTINGQPWEEFFKK